MKVGIIGCGFIGGALKQWLEEFTTHTVAVNDPPKGMNDDLTGCAAFFVSLHIETEADGSQDLTLLKEIIAKLPPAPVFIRTTILPGTADKLTAELGRPVYFMPEFLTQRTAYEDFKAQPMIFTGEVPLLEEIFPNKKHIVATSREAELIKYAHNVFGAVKVTYFNAVYDLCQRTGCDYTKVREGVLLSGYINDMHTAVPGPDGQLGYGGKCFPKDVNAFIENTKGSPMHDLLAVVPTLNKIFRP